MQNENKMFYGWKIVAVGFIIMSLVYSMASVTGVFLIPVTESLKISRAQFSLCSIFAAGGFVAGSAVMGKMFRKYKIKNVMIVGCAVICTDLLMKSFATQLWQLCICDLLLGIAYAAASVIPIPLLINNWFGVRKRGLANSLALAGSGLGAMVMTVILNAVIQNFSWRWAYRLNMVLILVIVIPAIFLVVVSTPQEKGLEKLGDIQTPEKQSKEKSGMSVKEAKKTGYFWMILLSFLFLASVNASVSSSEISYLNDIGFSSTMAANIGAVVIGSLTVGKILLGILCDKCGLKKGALFSNLLFTVSIAALYLTISVHSAVYLHVICFCIGGSMITVGVPLYVAQLFGDKEYSSFLGLINAMTGLGLPVGTVLGGVIYTAFGSYAPLWMLMTVLGALSTIFMFLCFGMKSRARR